MTLGPVGPEICFSFSDAKESLVRLISDGSERRSSDHPDTLTFPGSGPSRRSRTPVRRGLLALGVTVCLIAFAPTASAGTDAQALGVAWAQNWDKSQFMHQRPLRVIDIACAAGGTNIYFCKAETLNHRTGKAGCMVLSIGANEQLLNAVAIRMSVCQSSSAYEM